MWFRAFLLVILAGAACSTLPEGQRSTKPVAGPPAVEQETVERHAAQFDEEEPVRPAGSQEELAASAYIVAHLTDAGYVSRLDAVPVKDLVRSTNVVALPPGGADPAVLVAVAYDSSPDAPRGGLAIGVWLEVARALRAVEPDHAVEFVALGAEHAAVEGGNLGSRRLARQLTDEDRAPDVIVVDRVGGRALTAVGEAAASLASEARALGFSLGRRAPASGAGEVFSAAGFDTTVVSGSAAAVGPVLLAYLSSL
jgi:hypothetical protein